MNENIRSDERIKFVLTDEPISKSMAEVIEKTAKGQRVTKEVLMGVPEVALGFQILSQCPQSTMNLDQVVRRPLQNSIIKKLNNIGSFTRYDEDANGNKVPVYESPIECDRQIHIVMGFPASGKSTGLVDVVSRNFGAKVLDNDIPKGWIPEYFDGWGDGTVHAEAMQLTDKVMVDSLQRGENIVIPKIGNPPDSLHSIMAKVNRQNQINELMGEKPYELYVHCMDLDANKTLSRCLRRFAETGRFVDPAWVHSYSDTPDCMKRSFEQLSQGYVDNDGEAYPVPVGTSIWTSDVEYGTQPILLKATGNIQKDDFILTARTDQTGVIGVKAETVEQNVADNKRLLCLTSIDQVNLLKNQIDVERMAASVINEKRIAAERQMNALFGLQPGDPNYISIEDPAFMSPSEEEAFDKRFEEQLDKLDNTHKALPSDVLKDYEPHTTTSGKSQGGVQSDSSKGVVKPDKAPLKDRLNAKLRSVADKAIGSDEKSVSGPNVK